MLLAGPGLASDIVCNHLRRHFPGLVAICEQKQSRLFLVRRRAARLGWGTALGQVGFMTLAMPVLRRGGVGRIEKIMADSGLDPTPMTDARQVESVNSQETAQLLRELAPAVVVVHGTRIISRATLAEIDCPIVNLHAGITPRYRGVHGGYWALADGRPDLVGSTVHLVDAGIDTGDVLAQVTFDTTDRRVRQ